MENISQMSLLEVAILLMEQKKNKQPIMNLIKEVLEMKGLDDEDKSLATQLYIDITTSSKFVYMGDGEWDLKIRQSLDEYDKDGSAFNSKEELFEEDDDIKDVEIDEYEDEDDSEYYDDDEYDDDYDDEDEEDEDDDDDYEEDDESETDADVSEEDDEDDGEWPYLVKH